jgi:hypothetical protein
MILEAPLPGIAPFTIFVNNLTSGIWWFPFHLVPDLPEKLVAGKERLYLS